MSPYVVPDHVLERNLSTSLTPTFWGTLTIVSFDSLDSDSPQLKSSVIHENPLPAQPFALSEELENTSTPLSKSIDLPAAQHKHLYFDDGSITFRVQNTLYRLHRSLLCRGSTKFENVLSQLSAQQESTTSPTIPLDDVKAVDFDAFLSIIYPQNYDTVDKRTFEQWSAILDLSTRWGFTSIRDLAIRCTKHPNPLDRLILARKHAVEEWTLPALLELCERPKPLSLEEARLMDFEDVVLVGSVRQAVRSSVLTVNGTGVGNCIRAWKGEEPCSSVPDTPKNAVQIHLPQSDTPPPQMSTGRPIFNTGSVSAQPTRAGDDDWGTSGGLKKKNMKRR